MAQTHGAMQISLLIRELDPEPVQNPGQFLNWTRNRQRSKVSSRTGPGTGKQLKSVLEPEPQNQNRQEKIPVTSVTENLVLVQSAIHRQAQARAYVRMHLVKAYLMTYHIVPLQI